MSAKNVQLHIEHLIDHFLNHLSYVHRSVFFFFPFIIFNFFIFPKAHWKLLDNSSKLYTHRPLQGTLSSLGNSQALLVLSCLDTPEHLCSLFGSLPWLKRYLDLKASASRRRGEGGGGREGGGGEEGGRGGGVDGGGERTGAASCFQRFARHRHFCTGKEIYTQLVFVVALLVQGHYMLWSEDFFSTGSCFI